MFETPPRRLTYVIACPSGLQRTRPLAVQIASNILMGAPPAIGIRAIFKGGGEPPLVESCAYQQAINVPSGEMAGALDGLSLSCTGSPPSIDTFHRVFCQGVVFGPPCE